MDYWIWNEMMKWSTEKLYNLCLHTQPGFSVVFAFTSPPPGRNSHPCPTFPSLAQNWQTDSYSDCLLENAYPQQASLDHCGHDGLLQGRWSLACLIWFENKLWEILQLNGNVYLLICFFSIGARPKFTKRNSMDSVELWKYSSDKVISLSRIYVRLSKEKCACKCNPRISPQKSYKSHSHSMFFYCRMVRTKTLTAYPGEPRVSCHNRAKEKAILTVSHQMKGRGWTLL